MIGRPVRVVIGHWRRLSGPPPMNEFSDFDNYWEQRGRLKTIFRRWEVAADYIEDGASVLDVGCGTGEFLAYLKSRRPNTKCTGVDFSDNAISITRSQGFDADRANLAEEDLTGTFDYVTCFEVLEHIPEAEIALRRLKKCFRRQLIVSTPNVGYFGCRLRLAVFGRFPITMCVMHIKEHVRHWTPKDFKEWVAREGLRVVRVEGQYGLRFTPWKLWPSLFARGVVYVIEHAK